MDIVAAKFGNHREGARAHHLKELLDQGELQLGVAVLIVAVNGAAGTRGPGPVELGAPGRLKTQSERLQGLGGVDIKRHIGAVADLGTYRPAAQVGIHAQAVELDIFRELQHVGGLARRVGVKLRRPQKGVINRGVAHNATKVRQAAMVVDKVEAEFGGVEVFRIVLERNAVLAGIAGLLVTTGVAVNSSLGY